MLAIDLRGSLTGLVLLKITQAFRALGDGECMRLLNDDPVLPKEVRQVLARYPYRIERFQKKEGAVVIWIRKETE